MPAMPDCPARPICAVCNRPVDQFIERRDDFMGRTAFTVRCHGKFERVYLYDDEGSGSVAFGAAFTREAARLLR